MFGLRVFGLRVGDVAFSGAALVLGAFVYGLRSAVFGQQETMAIALGSVPSFLFMIALGMALLASAKSSAERGVMLTTATCAALALEFLQGREATSSYLEFISLQPLAWGTFDPADIAAILLASALLMVTGTVRAKS